MSEPQRSLCQKTVLMRALCWPQRSPPTANLKRYTTLVDVTLLYQQRHHRTVIRHDGLLPVCAAPEWCGYRKYHPKRRELLPDTH